MDPLHFLTFSILSHPIQCISILFALDICSLQIFGYQKHLETITPAWLFHDSSRFQTPDSAWAKAPVVDESSAATGSNGVAGLEVGQR